MYMMLDICLRWILWWPLPWTEASRWTRNMCPLPLHFFWGGGWPLTYFWYPLLSMLNGLWRPNEEISWCISHEIFLRGGGLPPPPTSGKSNAFILFLPIKKFFIKFTSVWNLTVYRQKIILTRMYIIKCNFFQNPFYKHHPPPSNKFWFFTFFNIESTLTV